MTPSRRAAVAPERRPRIVHVITGLGIGGAETMLYKLLSATQHAPERATVISITGDGPVGQRIRSLGVPVRILGVVPRLPNPLAILRLSRWIRESEPDIVQTWMYHADLMGGLAAKLPSPGVPVIWNIRASNLDRKFYKPSARLAAHLCILLSRSIPRRIVSCSQLGARVHTAMGYPEARITVIPNGFDLETFRPDPQARRAVRTELDIPPEALLIGLAARFHPVKNHCGFVHAAKILAAEDLDCRFLLCGAGVNWRNVRLAAWIEEAGLRDRFRFLGERADMARINAALDIATLNSVAAEGFPNVLGEAMACGVPCVATDVGDSALVIGDSGRIVLPGDSQALAEAWLELYRLGPEGRRKLGQRALARVRNNFGLPSIAARYEALYRSEAISS